MFSIYAFLRKISDNYYDIIATESINEQFMKIMKIDNYDFAFKIDPAAVDLITAVRKKGGIALVKSSFNKVILFEDIISFTPEEYVKFVVKKQLKTGPDEEIDIEDEDIKNEYIFETKKRDLLKNVLNKWFPMYNIFDIINIIKYLEYWGILFNAGFVVTDENKEDIFIEIIEKDDERLLNILEKFLESKDIFNKFNEKYTIYNKLLEAFDYMSYWDFENLEEAIKALEDSYNTFVSESDKVKSTKSDIELLYEIKNKLKEEK